MPSFEDYKSAFQMRDTVDRLVMNVVERERPKPRLATVVSWDREAAVCMVQYPEGGDPMPAQMGSVQPTFVGQTVKIEGPSGNKVLTEVYGQAHYETWESAAGEPRERLWMILGGATDNSNWPGSVAQYDVCYFGGYDISANVNGAWKESKQFVRRGIYALTSYFLKGANIGQHAAFIDGVQWGSTIEGYNATYVGGNAFHGFITFDEDAERTIRIQCMGKHASATAYYIALSCVQLYRMPW